MQPNYILSALIKAINPGNFSLTIKPPTNTKKGLITLRWKGAILWKKDIKPEVL